MIYDVIKFLQFNICCIVLETVLLSAVLCVNIFNYLFYTERHNSSIKIGLEQKNALKEKFNKKVSMIKSLPGLSRFIKIIINLQIRECITNC